MESFEGKIYYALLVARVENKMIVNGQVSLGRFIRLLFSSLNDPIFLSSFLDNEWDMIYVLS